VYTKKKSEYDGLKKEKDAFKKQLEDIDVTFEPMLEKKKEAEKKLIKLKSSLVEKVI
jgi:peptidoglycan hydrolase CwlO-like protein